MRRSARTGDPYFKSVGLEKAPPQSPDFDIGVRADSNSFVYRLSEQYVHIFCVRISRSVLSHLLPPSYIFADDGGGRFAWARVWALRVS